MTESVAKKTSLDADTGPGLASRATRGAVWTTLSMVVSRASQFVSQIVLAWLLLPEDFGLIGLAYSIMAFIWSLQQAGVGYVLIQRQRRFDRWSNPTAWMTLVAGLLAAAATLAIAPSAAAFYGNEMLIGVLAVLAASIPFQALATVPQAKLYAQLRMRENAAIEIGKVLCTTILSIAFAWAGFGVFSFVLPRLVTTVIVLPVYWLVARPKVALRPHFKLWPYLLSSIGWVTATGLVGHLMTQGDYAILGRFLDEDAVGIYYLAFMLSSQTMMLLTLNFGGIILPTLAKLRNDARRQVGAFLEICGTLALLAMPMCATLAVAARPLVEVCFDDRWRGVGPLLEWLAIGIGFRLVGHNGNYLLQSNGLWKKFFTLTCINSSVFLVACFVGVQLGGSQGVAIAVSCFFAIFGLTQILISFPSATERRLARTLAVYRDGLLVALVASAASLAIAFSLNLPAFADFALRIFSMTLFSILAARILTPRAFFRVWGRIQNGLLRKKIT